MHAVTDLMYRKKFPEHIVNIDEAEEYVDKIDMTYEPLDAEGASDYEKMKMEELYLRGQENPEGVLTELFDLTARFPQNKILANYLYVCLARTGRSEEAHELVKNNFKKFPGYLIDRLNYATSLMERGQYDEAKETVHGPSSLGDFVSDRKVHFTEAISFFFFWSLYYLRTGDITKAEFYYRVAWSIDPESDRVLTLRKMLSKAKVEAMGIK